MLAYAFLSILLAGPIPESALTDINPLEISPEMEQFVARQIGFGLAPKQRLQLLVSAIFQDKEMNFIYAPVSRSASETFQHRNGKCLSFTLMFIAMARYLDLDARIYDKLGKPKLVLENLKLARKTASQSEDKLRYEEKLAAMKSFFAAAEKR